MGHEKETNCTGKKVYKLLSCLMLALLVLVLVAHHPTEGGENMLVQPDDALQMLREGNARFVAIQPLRPHQTPDRRQETVAEGQRPFAVILGCADSRVPPEVLFDQGIGDLFVVRVAGNVAGIDQIASIEYAVDHLASPLVVVLGHSHCGAVTAAVEGGEGHGNVPILLKNIVPAVNRVKATNPQAPMHELVDQAIEANVWEAIENLFSLSPIVAKRVKEGKLKVVGAIYDLETGQVTWKGPHPQQEHLVSRHEGKKGKAH